MLLTILVCAALVGAPPIPLSAPRAAAAQAESRETEFWMGEITTYQPQFPAIPFVLTLRRVPTPDGSQQTWTGQIDIPPATRGLGVRARPIREVSYDQQSLQFTAVSGEGGDRFMLALEPPPAVPVPPGWRPKFARGEATMSGMHTLPALAWRVSRDEALDALPRRPQSPRPPFPYDRFELTFEALSDQAILAGTALVPRGDGPHPAVVIVSGDGPQDRDGSNGWHVPFHVIADRLAREGIAVLRFDDRGKGESGAASTPAPTFEQRRADVRGALAALGRLERIDRQRIGLLSHGDGSLVAADIAASDPSITFLAMLGPQGESGLDSALSQIRTSLELQGESPEFVGMRVRNAERTFRTLADDSPREESVGAMKAEIRAFIDARPGNMPAASEESLDSMASRQYSAQGQHEFRAWLRASPDAALRRLTIPVLALCGELDTIFPSGPASAGLRKALEQSPSRETVVEVLPGLNHYLQPAVTGAADEYVTIETTIDPRALDKLTKWVRVRAGLED